MRYTAPEKGASFSNRHGATIVLGPGEVLIAGKSFIESALKAGCNVEPDDTPESAADREKFESIIRASVEAKVRAEEKEKLRVELTREIREQVEREMREGEPLVVETSLHSSQKPMRRGDRPTTPPIPPYPPFVPAEVYENYPANLPARPEGPPEPEVPPEPPFVPPTGPTPGTEHSVNELFQKPESNGTPQGRRRR